MGVIAMRTGVVWGAAGWLCRSVVRYSIGRLGELDWLLRFRDGLERGANRIELGSEDTEAVRAFRGCVEELTEMKALRDYFPNITDDAILKRISDRLADLVALIDRELLDAA